MAMPRAMREHLADVAGREVVRAAVALAAPRAAHGLTRDAVSRLVTALIAEAIDPSDPSLEPVRDLAPRLAAMARAARLLEAPATRPLAQSSWFTELLRDGGMVNQSIGKVLRDERITTVTDLALILDASVSRSSDSFHRLRETLRGLSGPAPGQFMRYELPNLRRSLLDPENETTATIMLGRLTPGLDEPREPNAIGVRLIGAVNGTRACSFDVLISIDVEGKPVGPATVRLSEPLAAELAMPCTRPSDGARAFLHAVAEQRGWL